LRNQSGDRLHLQGGRLTPQTAADDIRLPDGPYTLTSRGVLGHI